MGVAPFAEESLHLLRALAVVGASLVVARGAPALAGHEEAEIASCVDRRNRARIRGRAGLVRRHPLPEGGREQTERTAEDHVVGERLVVEVEVPRDRGGG